MAELRVEFRLNLGLNSLGYPRNNLFFSLQNYAILNTVLQFWEEYGLRCIAGVRSHMENPGNTRLLENYIHGCIALIPNPERVFLLLENDIYDYSR